MIPEVNDSKKLSALKREELAHRVKETALCVGVGLCSPEEIDRLNILWAAMEAMRRAASDLTTNPDFLLIDGNRCFPDAAWPYETLVKGDARSFTIASASIIAKTVRDAYMHDMHQVYPDYGWDTNVGYPTAKHYKALAEHGPTPFHRQSFRLK